MYYVEKQPCVKLHAWPQVQFGIDALCSRRRIKKQFHCIGRLYVVFFTRSLTQFSICWACFMAPRPLKAIQIWLKESTVLIWRYCTLSAMLEICNFVREATQFELLDHISLYSYFLASLFSKMVKSVCLNCPSKEHIQILTGFSRFKNASCQSELEFNSHLRSKGSCFYSRFNIYIFFCSNTCSGREGALNFVSVSVYQSMYSRQQTESENFAECSVAAAMSARPWECENINYRLMPHRAAKKDSGW